VPVLEAVKRMELVEQARAFGLALHALSTRDGTILYKADLRSPSALVVGGEGRGVSAELLTYASALSVPAQNVESLNAAVACSIALFETARQRGYV
jgi:tRNA G18 (ribose-2'-O)-methylase SpoU